MYALEAMIANSRAGDESDAFAQLVLACGHVGTIVDLETDDPEFSKKQAVQVHKMLMSAIAVFERQTDAEWVPLWKLLLLFFLLQALVIFIVPSGRDFQDERPWRHG